MAIHYGPTNDRYFKYNALLLTGNGTNGAQNNTFVDSSSNNFTITRTGNVAQGTFSPFSLEAGKWAYYFDTTGDSIAVSDTTTSGNFPDGTDFTIEFWWRAKTGAETSNVIVSKSGFTSTTADSWFIGTDAKKLYFSGHSGSSTFTPVTSTTSIIDSQWHHCAISREGTTYRIFIDGVLEQTASNSTSMNQGTTRNVWFAGVNQFATYSLTGYISNLRIVKGTAVYTSSFTVPTSPLTAITNTLILTAQDNRFKDNSSNNYSVSVGRGTPKVTAFSPFAPSAAYSASTNGGSAYFDGSGDYLTAPTSTQYNIGTGDFTLECWVYQTANSAVRGVCGNHGINPNGVGIYINGGTPNGQVFQSGFSPDSVSGAAILLNSWNHLALVRSSGSLKMYVNGVGGTAVSSSNNPNNTVAFYVGSYEETTYLMTGYISDVRFTPGTAVYTTNFTAPTSPLSNLANTKLSFRFINAGIYDNSGKNDIETVGNAQISTSVKKYGTGSMYFDGTGDYLTSSANGVFGLTGDFTIECWYYLTVVNTISMLVGSSGTNPSDYIGVTSTRIMLGIGNTSYPEWTATSTSGTWYHLAVVRQSGTIKVYQNGNALTIASGSASNSNVFLPINQGVIVGLYTGGNGGGYPLNGHIDDLRITKGIARYTGNFTPPPEHRLR